MKRDSSPPDAIRVSGPNGAPGLVDTSNSTRSVPDGPGSAARKLVRKRAESSFSGASSAATAASSRGRGFAPLAAKRLGGGRISLAGRRQLGVELGDPLAAGFDRRQLRAHLLAKVGQRVGLDPVLAGEAADVEQARLDIVQPRRVERQRLGGARDPLLGLVALDQRPVERGQRFGQQRMVGGAALQPPGDLPHPGQRAVGPAEQFVEPVERFARLGAGLDRRPLLGQLRLLAGFGRKRLDLGGGVGQIVAVALGARRFGAGLGERLLGLADQRPGGGDRRAVDPPELVEQRPVAARVEQAAVVMLAVDLDRQRGEVAKRAAPKPASRRRTPGCRRRS